MGEVTDAVGIQFRLLNTSRGPAVWSPRAQCDKQQERPKRGEVLESQPNLKIKQAEVAELIVESCGTAVPGGNDSADSSSAAEGGCATRVALGIKLRDGRTVGAQAIIITTGTFLNGLIHCGDQTYPAARTGQPPSQLLDASLNLPASHASRPKPHTHP